MKKHFAALEKAIAVFISQEVASAAPAQSFLRNVHQICVYECTRYFMNIFTVEEEANLSHKIGKLPLIRALDFCVKLNEIKKKVYTFSPE